MDRIKIGVVEFGKQTVLHKIENHDGRNSQALNYVNDFALATWAPLPVLKEYKVSIFVDRSSVELFINNGLVSMTSLIFPNMPYDNLKIISESGSCETKDLTIYELKN